MKAIGKTINQPDRSIGRCQQQSASVRGDRAAIKAGNHRAAFSQIFNTQAYAGLSNNTFGALTFGRQSTLTLDGVRVYDPMSATNAFSVIGDSAKTVAFVQA